MVSIAEAGIVWGISDYRKQRIISMLIEDFRGNGDKVIEEKGGESNILTREELDHEDVC